MNNIRLDSALMYRKLGYSVIPIMEKGKIPVIKSWKEYQNRLPDEKEILQWWQDFPAANIAIITGKISKLTIVDVDTQEFPTIFNGITTPHCKTGSGWHFYFRYAEGIGNKVKFQPNFDLRSEGGYCICPPSIHTSGKLYSWIISPEAANPLPLPESILGSLKLEQNEDFGSRLNPNILNGVGKGQRNQSAAQVI